MQLESGRAALRRAHQRSAEALTGEMGSCTVFVGRHAHRKQLESFLHVHLSMELERRNPPLMHIRAMRNPIINQMTTYDKTCLLPLPVTKVETLLLQTENRISTETRIRK